MIFIFSKFSLDFYRNPIDDFIVRFLTYIYGWKNIYMYFTLEYNIHVNFVSKLFALKT